MPHVRHRRVPLGLKAATNLGVTFCPELSRKRPVLSLVTTILNASRQSPDMKEDVAPLGTSKTNFQFFSNAASTTFEGGDIGDLENEGLNPAGIAGCSSPRSFLQNECLVCCHRRKGHFVTIGTSRRSLATNALFKHVAFSRRFTVPDCCIDRDWVSFGPLS